MKGGGGIMMGERERWKEERVRRKEYDGARTLSVAPIFCVDSYTARQLFFESQLMVMEIVGSICFGGVRPIALTRWRVDSF